jgi:hypothetical protein
MRRNPFPFLVRLRRRSTLHFQIEAEFHLDRIDDSAKDRNDDETVGDATSRTSCINGS